MDKSPSIVIYDTYGDNITCGALCALRELKAELNSYEIIPDDIDSIEKLIDDSGRLPALEAKINHIYKDLLKQHYRNIQYFFNPEIEPEQSFSTLLKYFQTDYMSIGNDYDIEALYQDDDFQAIKEILSGMANGLATTRNQTEQKEMTAKLYRCLIPTKITTRLFIIFLLLQAGHYEPSFITFAMEAILHYIDQTYFINKRIGYSYNWQALASACFFYILRYIYTEPTKHFIEKRDRQAVLNALLQAYSNYKGSTITLEELQESQIEEATDNNFFKKPLKDPSPITIKGLKNNLNLFDYSLARSESGENDQGILISIHLQAALQLQIALIQVDNIKKKYKEKLEILEANKADDDSIASNITTSSSAASKSPIQSTYVNAGKRRILIPLGSMGVLHDSNDSLKDTPRPDSRFSKQPNNAIHLRPIDRVSPATSASDSSNSLETVGSSSSKKVQSIRQAITDSKALDIDTDSRLISTPINIDDPEEDNDLS